MQRTSSGDPRYSRSSLCGLSAGDAVAVLSATGASGSLLRLLEDDACVAWGIMEAELNKAFVPKVGEGISCFTIIESRAPLDAGVCLVWVCVVGGKFELSKFEVARSSEVLTGIVLLCNDVDGSLA